MAWKEVLKEWKLKNKGVIPKAVLPSLLKKCLDSLKDGIARNLKAGFKGAGLHPVDRQQVLKRLPSVGKKSVGHNLGETLVTMFKKTRFNETQDSEVTQKKKMLKIAPGQSVSSEDALQLLKESKANTAKKAKKEQKSEEFKQDGEDGEYILGPGRKRPGRPRKSVPIKKQKVSCENSKTVFIKLETNNNEEMVQKTEKRRPGRPKKSG